MDIWRLTQTTVTKEENGIVYGGTMYYDIGPGFVNYCWNNKISISQRTLVNPTYNFFTNCTDRGDMSIVSCGITKSGSGQYSGHAMAVEGYSTLSSKSTGETLETLMIFDGWQDNVRYLNFDFNGWVDIEGIEFVG